MFTCDSAHQGLDNPARVDNPYDIDPYGTSDDVRPGMMATASPGATGQGLSFMVLVFFVNLLFVLCCLPRNNM